MTENANLSQQLREMEHEVNRNNVELEGVKARNRMLEAEIEELRRQQGRGGAAGSRVEDRQIGELQQQLRSILAENDNMKRHIEDLALKYDKDYKSKVTSY
jgi:cell division protein FtsB